MFFLRGYCHSIGQMFNATLDLANSHKLFTQLYFIHEKPLYCCLVCQIGILKRFEWKIKQYLYFFCIDLVAAWTWRFLFSNRHSTRIELSNRTNPNLCWVLTNSGENKVRLGLVRFGSVAKKCVTKSMRELYYDASLLFHRSKQSQVNYFKKNRKVLSTHPHWL